MFERLRRIELEAASSETRDQLGQIPFNRTPYRRPRVQLRPGQDVAPGRGVLVTGRQATRIQVAT